MEMKVVLALVVVLGLISRVQTLENGLGRTPQMGWNSWNRFACNINEYLIRETIYDLVSSGLAAAGYRYINMDDCWAGWRDASGFIHPDNNTFPSGVKYLADYAHSQGLLFGLYSDAGVKTCAGRPGSLNYEKNDANSYASWGVDYLKYDNCNNNHISPRIRYPVMRDALNATGRHIFYSMCEWGQENPATWAAAVGNSWRTTGDIKPRWDSIISRIDQNDKWWQYAAPGGFNDPDMLEVGNQGLTLNEQRAHFSLWALVKAPLLIGCDIRTLSSEIKDILTAPEVIAINQDPLGAQGHKVWSQPFHDGAIEFWAGPLANGDQAVVVFNRASSVSATTSVPLNLVGIPANTTVTIRDVWARKNIGSARRSFTTTVEPHSVEFFRLIKSN